MELARRTNLMSPSCAWLRSPSPRSTSLGVSRGHTLRSTAALHGSKSLSWLHGPGNRNRSSASAALEHGAVSSTALAIPSSLQVTARGWLASYDGRLSQNFWSQQAGPGGAARGSTESPTNREVRLPPIASDVAARENFKKEHYSTELDKIQACQDKNAGQLGGSPKHRARDFMLKRSKSLAELTKEVSTTSDIRSEIDHLIQCAKDQHQHFRPQKVAYEKLLKHEEKEREQAQKAEPAVRRRKRTDQPRNPKWRVEERIKRERERWKDTGEAPMCTENLPMTQFAIQGDHGKAEFSLVDVKSIQAQCQALSANCSVKSLLEAQRLHDEAAAAKKSSVTDNRNENRAELDALAALSWEDRLELAQRKKLQGHISRVFDRMGTMRGKYPKEVPDSLVNHLHAMHAGDYTWHEGDGLEL